MFDMSCILVCDNEIFGLKFIHIECFIQTAEPNKGILDTTTEMLCTVEGNES